MKILVDSDAFCKLAAGGLLDDAIRLLGADLSECGRLPALPYMLRRGRLRRVFGAEICDRLISIVNVVPVVPPPSEEWLDELIRIDTIDPGEAQIFAAAAEHGMFVVSGDKRALRALKDVEGFPPALAGRIILVEAILIALCEDLGSDEVRRRVQPLIGLDQLVQICFSNPGTNPIEGLRSYFNNLTDELVPLILWEPRSGGTP